MDDGSRSGNVTRDDRDWLTARFEEARTHLRAVAYRMLGSDTEAEDAVQETWLRLARAEPDGVEDLTAWLTTVVARVCLDRLRSRQSRPEEPAGDYPIPFIAEHDEELDPEEQVLLAETVGSALLIVLDQLAPDERVAFVLHDVFAVPFDEIGPIVSRSPSAARQLASRARRRLQGAPVTPRAELAHQRKVVDAFLAASREGDFDALLKLLDPDVIFRPDETAVRLGAPTETYGAAAVARAARGRARGARLGLIDGTVGLVYAPGGRPRIAFYFAITDGKIAAINMIADPERVADLDISVIDG
jgi:RNA polymerase sigma-70 factor (ECF subfamily)